MKCCAVRLTLPVLSALVFARVVPAGEEGLAAYGPMDGADGDTVLDVSGNDNHGKVYEAQWEGVREGIKDYNYVHTPVRLIGRAKESDNANEKAADRLPHCRTA